MRQSCSRSPSWGAPRLAANLRVTACCGYDSPPSGRATISKTRSPVWIDLWGALRQALFGGTAHTEPDAPVAVAHATFAQPPRSGLRVTWFGHSSSLVEIDGTRVLIDPFFSERASPFSFVGPKRWYPPPVPLADLANIDAVVISHDHYDHLDYPSIVAMRDWHNIFVVPLGVGAHLAAWGIAEGRIVELDWWQTAHVHSIDIVATPSRHASGRTGNATNQALWAGYALIGAQHRAWYSGDTGFHDGLSQIGARLGPFDVTLIESGQYNAKWPDVHLGPEQAVEAHRLVRGKVMIPVHWALIRLANHAWVEPVERVLAAAGCRHLPVLTPRPGESIEPSEMPQTARWWPALQWQTAGDAPVVATTHGDELERVRFLPCSGL